MVVLGLVCLIDVVREIEIHFDLVFDQCVKDLKCFLLDSRWVLGYLMTLDHFIDFLVDFLSLNQSNVQQSRFFKVFTRW
jgi:hypothetical protein